MTYNICRQYDRVIRGESMKTVVILSTDNLGMTVADMLNPREMKLVGMGDTRQETWNVFSDLEKGN